ncbi:hypothetical protein PENANT_c001G05910 [Penicillium antarcticum]|uniref:Uncharacterized protein n=1 Tax=Penicillium antarcticum TaxID=416450 RepID=A0A1V6QP68_9EURO|nr:uncharacterized protein N7508_010474 [Penicillium antarcticum]KAJ5295653.1 hypothetical protein N7508_010474 [Penicillium antarcticum]OQD91024.1 hypothetical protein PENANT_c001G05910 [Penicillium antarcticum]
MGSFYKFLAIAALLSSSALAQSQDPGPSPTASIGCEPHGDHWHCDGPASTSATDSVVLSTASDVEVTTTSAADATTSASVTPTMPSPTESVGCEPHNDHWHCDGPRETSSSSSSTSASASASASAGAEDEENGVSARGVEMLLLVGLSVVAAGLNA